MKMADKKISNEEALHILREAIKYAQTKGFNRNEATVFSSVFNRTSPENIMGFPIVGMLTYPAFTNRFYGGGLVGNKCGKIWADTGSVMEKYTLWQTEKNVGQSTWDWLNFETTYCTHYRDFNSEEYCEPIKSEAYHEFKLEPFSYGSNQSTQKILDYTRKHIPNYSYTEQVQAVMTIDPGNDEREVSSFRPGQVYRTAIAMTERRSDGTLREIPRGTEVIQIGGHYETLFGNLICNTFGMELSTSAVESYLANFDSNWRTNASGGAVTGGSGGSGSSGIRGNGSATRITGRAIAGANATMRAEGDIPAGTMVTVNPSTGEISSSQTPEGGVLNQAQLDHAIQVLSGTNINEFVQESTNVADTYWEQYAGQYDARADVALSTVVGRNDRPIRHHPDYGYFT